MKEYVLSNKKGLLLVLIAVLIMGVIEFQNRKYNNLINERLNNQVIESSKMHLINETNIKNEFFKENALKISFYAKTFQIDEDKLVAILNEDFNNIDYENIDKYLINTLLNFEKTHKSLFKNTIISSNPSKEYMLSLIKYFTSIYNNVDFTTAAAIAHIESGYRSSYMIQNNNIFGGLSGGKLIKYKTIEYGILKYIILLSEKYYGKGLTTISEIGRVYNPIIAENGGKIANPNWVKNVTNVMAKYENLIINNEVKDILS